MYPSLAGGPGLRAAGRPLRRHLHPAVQPDGSARLRPRLLRGDHPRLRERRVPRAAVGQRHGRPAALQPGVGAVRAARDRVALTDRAAGRPGGPGGPRTGAADARDERLDGLGGRPHLRPGTSVRSPDRLRLARGGDGGTAARAQHGRDAPRRSPGRGALGHAAGAGQGGPRAHRRGAGGSRLPPWVAPLGDHRDGLRSGDLRAAAVLGPAGDPAGRELRRPVRAHERGGGPPDANHGDGPQVADRALPAAPDRPARAALPAAAGRAAHLRLAVRLRPSDVLGPLVPVRRRPGPHRGGGDDRGSSPRRRPAAADRTCPGRRRDVVPAAPAGLLQGVGHRVLEDAVADAGSRPCPRQDPGRHRGRRLRRPGCADRPARRAEHDRGHLRGRRSSVADLRLRRRRLDRLRQRRRSDAGARLARLRPAHRQRRVRGGRAGRRGLRGPAHPGLPRRVAFPRMDVPTCRASLVYDESLTSYDFGPTHPMNPIRVDLTVALASHIGVLRTLPLVPAPDATDDELATVHDPELIEAVMAAGADPTRLDLEHGLGTDDDPTFPRMHEASRHVVGASIEAARQVWTGQVDHAANIAGGLHHAMPNRASGFCVYNDVAVAIAWLLDNGAKKVAYVDVDAHHGDGVERIFWDDPRVLTISIHEAGDALFPGTGWPRDLGGESAEGTAVNIALPPGTGDNQWL